MQLHQKLFPYINDNTRPLIFLGSSYTMYKLTEICDNSDIKIQGIIDTDYYGNTEHICDIPVIDNESGLKDNLAYYKDNFNFFCAVNWTPEPDPAIVRNRQKRNQLLSLIDEYQLNCISIVNHTAQVSKHSIIGRGVYLDAHVLIEPKVTVGDYTSIFYNSSIGHHSIIQRNCVFQRQSILMGDNLAEEEVYFSPAVKALKNGAIFGRGSWIQEAIYIRRGTVPGEIVSLNGENMRRVIPRHIID